MILHKVKNGGILYPRKFILDTQNMRLRYTGSEKKFRKKKTSCKEEKNYKLVVRKGPNLNSS
jgi:hypothetical protein